MRPHMKQADRAEQHDHREGGDKCRQQAIAERIIILRPDHRATLALFSVNFRSNRVAAEGSANSASSR
jgi:hypothetical protein